MVYFRKYNNIYYYLKRGIGDGVFARQSKKSEIIFKKGQMIAKYNGEFLQNKEYEIRYKRIFPDGPYAIELVNRIDKIVIDG